MRNTYASSISGWVLCGLLAPALGCNSSNADPAINAAGGQAHVSSGGSNGFGGAVASFGGCGGATCSTILATGGSLSDSTSGGSTTGGAPFASGGTQSGGSSPNGLGGTTTGSVPATTGIGGETTGGATTIANGGGRATGGAGNGGAGNGGAPAGGNATGGTMPRAGASTGGGATGGTTTGGTTSFASKPYMGWSSWSFYNGNISEAKIKGATDAMAATLLPYGYDRINVDDYWHNGFDSCGYWKPDPAKFPNGIKAVADYVHSKGMKFGIYLEPGINTVVWDANTTICGTSYKAKDIVSNSSAKGNTRTDTDQSKKIDFTKPGAVDYVQGYVNLMASWGVDFIKYDFVGPKSGGSTAIDNREDVRQMRAAIAKSGREIWLELSNFLSIDYAADWKKSANGWRVANDVEVYSGKRTDWAHVVRVINAVAPWVQHAGPGGWNDLDSLEIGNGADNGISMDERKTVMGFWALAAAPLYLGTDPTNFDAEDLKLLTNKEVIAIDQAAIPAKPVSTANNQQVWYAKHPDGSFAVGLFNFDSAAATVTARFSDIGAASSMKVRDVWSQTDLGATSTSFGVSLPAHGSRLVKLTP